MQGHWLLGRLAFLENNMTTNFKPTWVQALLKMVLTWHAPWGMAAPRFTVNPTTSDHSATNAAVTDAETGLLWGRCA